MKSVSYLTFRNLNSLVLDMRRKQVSKERFSFSYAKRVFDCIFSTRGTEYELLVGIHEINFGFVIPINERFVGSVDSDTFFRVKDVLCLSAGKNTFTSNILLNLLSSHIPTFSAGKEIPYEIMRKYVKCRSVEEADKRFFKGWNDHIKDGKTARNFDKTEFYLGKASADYCRANNISSLWSNVPTEETRITYPWE